MKLTEENFHHIRRYFKNPDFFIEEILGIDTGQIDPEIEVTQNQHLTTEQVCAYIIWYATFHIHDTALFVTNTVANRTNANKILLHMLGQVPEYMQHEIVRKTGTCIEMDTGTKIVLDVASPYTGKGRTLQLVVFDKYHKYHEDVQDQMLMGIIPAIWHTAQIVIVGEDDRFDW